MWVLQVLAKELEEAHGAIMGMHDAIHDARISGAGGSLDVGSPGDGKSLRRGVWGGGINSSLNSEVGASAAMTAHGLPGECLSVIGGTVAIQIVIATFVIYVNRQLIGILAWDKRINCICSAESEWLRSTMRGSPVLIVRESDAIRSEVSVLLTSPVVALEEIVCHYNACYAQCFVQYFKRRCYSKQVTW